MGESIFLDVEIGALVDMLMDNRLWAFTWNLNLKEGHAYLFRI